jgi:DNA-directed RNA polymerase specialized sigma24 family protein
MAKKQHYVNNKTLYEEMIKYKEKTEKCKEEGKQLPQVPRYVGECFLLICNKLSSKPNFMGYSYRDEMVADAIENCVYAAHSFDPAKSSNPFAYFTQIAWNAFIRRIAKEKKQAYIKHKNFVNSNLMEDIAREMSVSTQPFHNEYSDDIIRNFEDKIIKNSKKNKVGVEKFVKEEVNEELAPSTS